MNEQMLKLYKLAHLPHIARDPSNNMPYETTLFSPDRFSELIVKECATLAFDGPNGILEHFGVEE